MILVTLGTQDKEFTRVLIPYFLSWIKIWKYESKNMQIFDYVSRSELEKYISDADYIITHAGVGTIFDCLTKNKKVIAVARLSKYKEHNNDHQLEIVNEFGKEKLILPVIEIDELEQAIKKVKTFKPDKYRSNNKNMVKLVSDYIDGNECRGMIKLFNKYREVIMYLIFGVLTTIVSLVVYYALVYTVLNPDNGVQLQIANIISWMAGVTFAYFTNRKYVFESNNKNKLKEAGSFVLARVATLIMDMVIMFVGVTLLAGNDKIIKIISQVVVIVANYIFSKIFVFKKK